MVTSVFMLGVLRKQYKHTDKQACWAAPTSTSTSMSATEQEEAY